MNKKTIIIISGIALAVVLIVALGVWLISRSQTVAEADTDEQDAPTVIQEQPDRPAPIVGLGFSIAPTSLGDITIEPTRADNSGVAIDSGFLISSETRTLTQEHLLAYLSVPSGEGFTLEEQANNTFLLRFDDNLENHQVYNLVYQPPGQQAVSHAFQTQDVFRVSATSPANSSHGIPTNAGIEITFSQELAGDFADYFSIDPPLDGTFLQRGNTHIFAPGFAPMNSLEFGTRYTVTIYQGLRSTSGEVLEADHTFAFTTQWGTGGGQAFSIAGNAYETFLPWDEVFIALHRSQDFRGSEFYVNLYELPDGDSFINFTDTGAGQLVDTLRIELREFVTEWQSFFYLFLEQTLPAGYYVAEIRSADTSSIHVLHKFIQVSGLSVYSLSISGEALLWVHDAATGLPAVGAQIGTPDGAGATTNSDGIAIVDTAQHARAPFRIEYGYHLPFVYTMPTFEERLLIPNDRFLSYMYTDRPFYRPNDTVDVFGVILPRYGHAHLPSDEFTLRFGDMMHLPITLDAHNSFAMRVPITNMFRWTEVVVEVNGERLMSAHVNFIDYTNLAFVLEGQLDRLAYFSGQYAQAQVSVTTFAGMPVEGINLRHGWGDNAITITTDNEGIAARAMTVPGGHSWWDGWEPHWHSYWFTVANDAQVSQSVSLPLVVVPSDIMLEHNYQGGSSITITTSRILIDEIDRRYADARPWSPISRDAYRGPAVDADFTVEIERHVTTRTVRAQNYDHINRRTVNVYDFNTTTSHYRTMQGRTVGGTTTIAGLPVSNDPMIRYSIEITYNDSAGRNVRVRVIDNSWRHFEQESTIRHFALVPGNANLQVGQTTNISLIENPNNTWWWGGEITDGATPVTQGRLLTILHRDRIIDARVGNPGGMPVTFTEELISSAQVFGAYFDGTYIFPITNAISLTYAYEERELDIDLSFDRPRYAPGDAVTVTVQTSGAAQVLISVVDESAILTDWHDANFLSRLYRSSWHRWHSFHQFASHTQHNFGGAGGGAEGGGGDGDGSEGAFRDRFVDNPIFEVIQTDANGRGTLTFTLPDQVTSWRVTAIGLTQDGLAGDTRYNIISHLDFYVDLMLTNEYILGDDIAAVARAFGSNGRVNFVFNVLQDDMPVYTGGLTAIRSGMFNAGKLDVGEYIMQVTATYGAHSDAVELPFTVVETGMILPMRAAARIENAADTAAIQGLAMRNLPVRVTLTNADIGPVTSILRGMWYPNSFRTDYIAATAFINYFFTGEQDFDDARARIRGDGWQGGIPELVYEDPDFYYTARFIASLPEFVDRDRVMTYINRELQDSHGTRMRAASLLAFAALGEPVLFEIYQEVYNVGSSDHWALLYLTAALVAIGDDAGAADLIHFIPEDFGQDATDASRETINTLRFFINTTIDPQAAWAHLNRGSANVFVSDVPERINFVRRTRVLGTTTSEVQYYLNGTTHTVRLEDFDRVSLHLTQEQFDNLNLIPISGATDFHIDFFGYDAENWLDRDNRAEVARTIVRDGDLYRINLRVTIPADARGFYTVYDRLPSNMRFVPVQNRNNWRAGNHFWVRHVQRQLVEISFFVDQNQSLTRTVSYHAMMLFDADMADGTTFISNGCVQNHVWGMTE